MAPLSEMRLNSKLGTGSGPGSLSPSHEIKGCWDPCVFTGFSQHCEAQCHEHTRPGNQFKAAAGPSVQINRANHLFPVLVEWEKNYSIMARPPPKAGAPKGWSKVCREAQSYGHFLHCILFITQQANTVSLDRRCVFS